MGCPTLGRPGPNCRPCGVEENIDLIVVLGHNKATCAFVRVKLPATIAQAAASVYDRYRRAAATTESDERRVQVLAVLLMKI